MASFKMLQKSQKVQPSDHVQQEKPPALCSTDWEARGYEQQKLKAVAVWSELNSKLRLQLQEVSTTNTWTKLPEADQNDPVANDLEKQSRVTTGFSSISKRLTSLDMLKPVAAFEHELSFLCRALNARSQEVDICISYGPLGKHGVHLYVYRVSLDNNLLSEGTLLQSFSLDSYENFGADYLQSQVALPRAGWHCDLFKLIGASQLVRDDIVGTSACERY
ncbi:hypothetical protein SELMODRAFT_424199 [Selaginella moellendorffii]|uniref:Uncharacterized protein n=1 Tax=Selaginella moellendorffii TaxID=88036 RepID=D8SP49_SELML|nr:hypothetical protein SELMODRAFT_424199 [Selaginella moellendorffii]